MVILKVSTVLQILFAIHGDLVLVLKHYIFYISHNFQCCVPSFSIYSLLIFLAPDQMNLPAQMPRPDDGMRGGGEGVMNTIYSDSSSSSNSNSNAESREGTSSGPRLGRGSGSVESLNGSKTRSP